MRLGCYRTLRPMWAGRRRFLTEYVAEGSHMSDEIRPFRIDIDQGALDDLRARLARTRWPEAETVDDWSQGIPLAYVRELCDYWRDGYDWRAAEARLNAIPQFKTDIDGIGVHFLHVRSPVESAAPLVITHGWPGSVVEFLKVIGPLSDPASHGGSDADAFHLVIPSIPGYGFSDKPARHGWGVERIARAWSVLMARLGYDRYFAQGGDWGSMITTSVGTLDTEHCIGLHTNMPVVFPPPRDARGPDRPGARRAGGAEVLPGLGLRLFQAAEHASADAGLRPGRFARRAGGLDRREVLPVDGLQRPSGKRADPRRAARQRDVLLADRLRPHRPPGCIGRASAASRWTR